MTRRADIYKTLESKIINIAVCVDGTHICTVFCDDYAIENYERDTLKFFNIVTRSNGMVTASIFVNEYIDFIG